MSDTPPTGFGSLFTPDTISGVILSVGASFIAGLQAAVRGWGLLTTGASAALLSAVLQPIFRQYGFTWGDWLGAACLVTGVTAGAAFMLVARIGQRVLARGDSLADNAIDRVLGPEKKP